MTINSRELGEMAVRQQKIIDHLAEKITALEARIEENEIDISNLHERMYNFEMLGLSHGYYHVLGRWKKKEEIK